jgi:elongator complex protein 3
MDHAHEYTDKDLETVLLAIISAKPTSRAEFDDARRIICGDIGINQPANNLLTGAYQKMIENGRVQKDEELMRFMTKADVRNISGIAVITSLIKPYLCPGKCVYCPTEARMPKSYLANEPAAARALRLDFSPYEQMKQRIGMLERNGHSCDKIEYIIKGGTWNAYPLKYQYWFIYESFKAANDLAREIPLGPVDEAVFSINTIEQMQEVLDAEQTFNETAKHRIIGLTLETRPDAIAPKTILHMRRQGCTRIELGLQAPDDKILELIKRGHTTEQFRKAMHLLRDVGFKVDLHFMPDLPGTTPEHDVEMYKSIFTDEGLKPDMVKIYPNTVIKSAELYQWLLDGRYKPYGAEGLFRALLEMKKATPYYCRISRLIRDIPETDIEAGNKITNLREALEKELHARGEKCVCLRCREIGRQLKHVDPAVDPQLFVEEYTTRGGTEYFLSFEDSKRIAVYGFLRLRIPHTQNEPLLALFPELQHAAFVRELHVYGKLVKIGQRAELSTQHTGLGKALVAAAEEIAKKHSFSKVAIISGVGVREYYEKLGYTKQGTYMVKNLV